MEMSDMLQLTQPMRALFASLALAVLTCLSEALFAMNAEDYEEPAGSSIGFLFSTEDDIYGISGGSGTWLKNTPVFGDYFVRLFSNGTEDAFYSGVGMTLRVMPHWRVAPFVGAGGSYNFSFSSEDDTDIQGPVMPMEADTVTDRGDSYWGGHAEAGVRIWFNHRSSLFEVFVRQTTTSLEGDRDYWLIGISTGVGI